MEDNLWTLCNIITGFSIVQNLTFLYALGKDLRNLQSLAGGQKKILVVLIVFFSALYSSTLWWLSDLAKHLPSHYPVVWDEVTLGRCAAVVLFALLAVFGLFAPEAFVKLGGKGQQPGAPPVGQSNAGRAPPGT